MKQTVIPKPAHGAACNSCGACCETMLCPIASAIFGDASGPCPGLEPQADGRQTCGVYANPSRYMPVRSAIVGEGILRVALGIIMGQGADATGCDACAAGEPYDHAYAAAVDRRFADPIAKRRRAAAAQTIGEEIMRASAQAALTMYRRPAQQ